MHHRPNPLMQRDINITIKLEGIDKFSIRIPAEQEKNAREAERTVNLLYNSWKERFAHLSSNELLARISFYLARKFEDLNSELLAVEATVDDCEGVFDRILLDMD